jgi:hypothetical protein
MAQHLAEHSSPDWRSFQIALSHRPTGGAVKTRQIVDFSSPLACPQLDYPGSAQRFQRFSHKRQWFAIYKIIYLTLLAI